MENYKKDFHCRQGRRAGKEREEEIRVYYLIQRRVDWFAGRTANSLLGVWVITKKGKHIGRREALHIPGAAIHKEPHTALLH